ncbi:MAG: sugar transferase, partial [Desulfobacterales bacterium]|nr:sugar transferase [Desulfobacterales bacterium]
NNLYNTHFIFLKKTHLNHLLASLAWGLITISLMLFISLNVIRLFNHLAVSVMVTASVFYLVFRYVKDQFFNLVKSIGTACMLSGLLLIIHNDVFVLFQQNVPLILWASLTAAATILAGRFLMVHFFLNRVFKRRFRRQLLIVGSNDEAKSILSHIVAYNAPYWIAGVVGECGIQASASKECLGSIADLARIAQQNRTDELIVTNEDMDKKTLISLLDYCTSQGMTVWFPPKMMPIIDIKLYPATFCGLSMIRLCSQKNNWLYEKCKHAMDALLALPLAVMLLPIFLLIGSAVKLSSKGPIFYRARAIGKNGKEFMLYKFRTMVLNSSPDIHKQYVTRLINGEIKKSETNGAPLKITNDPRITRVGKILRKLSLDELPQFFNVLKGEMSLVGPRPCLPYEFDVYKDWHKKRTGVRPGISGLWQVVGRSEVTFDDMILLDLYYIYNRNLLMDVMILCKTVLVVIRSRGAY